MFIGEYQVVEELLNVDGTCVYTARRPFYGGFYLIWVYGLDKHKKRFFNEFSINRDYYIASGLDHPNIAKPIGTFICDQGLAMVYKYVEGTTLEKIFLSEEKMFSLSDCFKIAIQILDALHYIHSRGIIHCNINPQTIFISNDNGVKLIDFRHALTDDEVYLVPEGKIVGKIPYISPEQTGFIENKIDARSDILCVGVVLYKLLSGNVPFGVENGTMEQLLTSMFKKEIAPIRSMHVYVNEILLKALRVTPSERYQTALGLKYDIQRVSEILIDGCRRSFSLGKKDLLIAAGESKVFISRDEELLALKKSYDNFLKRKSMSVLLFGPSGIGKTETVKQFRKSLKSDGHIQFINVKCNQFTIHQPFSVYYQIIHAIINSIDMELMGESTNSIIDYLNIKMQDNSGLICKFFPEMSKLFSHINTIDQIEPDKEADRLNYVLSNLLKTFCMKLRLILFIDDIQCIDKVSNDILMNSRNINCPIMLISTLRTDGEFSGKMLFGNQIARTADKIIELRPLHETDIEWYLWYQFGEIINKYSLCKLILHKCNGNPFVILELIKYLIESSLLCRNGNKWEFIDSDTSSLPSRFDSVSLIMHRFSRFNKEQMQFLQICAIIGKADKDLINKFGCFDDKLSTIIREMEYVGIIRLTGNGECIFLHDKIHAAVLKTIAESSRVKLYEKLANVYETKVEQDPDYLFKTANAYFNTGNMEKALLYSYQAGVYAKEILALDHSVRFFRNALLLANQIKKNGELDPKFSVHKISLLLGDSLLLTGKHGQAMHVFNDLLENDDGKNKELTIELLSKLGIIFYKMGEFKQSIVCIKKALACLEVRIPEKRISIYFNLTIELVRQVLHTVGIKRKKRKSTDREIALLRLTQKLSMSLYFTDAVDSLYYHLKALNLSDKLEYGYDSVEVCLAHGVAAHQLFMKKRALKYVMNAISQAQKLNRTDLLASGYSYLGIVNYFNARWNDAEEDFNKSMELFESIGDMSSKSLCTEHLWKIQLMKGLLSDAKKSIQYTIENSRKVEDKHYLKSATSAKVVINTIQSKGSSPQDVELVKKSLKVDDVFLTYTLTAISALQKNILEGNYDLAEEISDQLFPLICKKSLNYEYTAPAFSLMCELIYRKYSEDGFDAKKDLRKQYKKSLKKLICASICYPAYRGALYRAIAWYLILAKKERFVSYFFNMSIDNYHRFDINYEKGRTVNEYGNFLAKTNAPGFARNKFDEACKIFHNIGASFETDLLADKVSDEMRREISSNNDNSFAVPLENSNHVRFDTLLTVSSSISGINEVPVLLNQILTAMIKVTGAQYGGIFLSDYHNVSKKIVLRDYLGNDLKSQDVFVSAKIIEMTRQYKQVICIKDGMEEEFSDNGLDKNKSVLCAPLYQDENYMGCVYLGNDKMSGLFSESAVKSAQILAAQASIFIGNAFLMEKYKQLNRDLDIKVKQQTQDILEKNHQLEITNLKLVESERMRGILSGTLVHDIKNYAAGIEGNVQYLGRKLQYDPKIKRIVGMVGDTCSDIVSLASNLLDVAKMDDGKLVIRAENILYEYIESMILKFTENSLFEEKNISFNINAPTEAFIIRADMYLLERVLQNMISNAAKYIPKNGIFELSFDSEDDRNVICFFNSGRPIPDKEKDALFEKYARLENRQSQYSKGLGLFFCRMVMNAHNGKIWVDSDEKGNYFKLAFPRVEENFSQIQTPFEIMQA